jgi:hypothetical protein
MKLVQLAGYVSEVAAYHHGEKSLQDTIVKLATDFVGSNNNVPLLFPGGQFGTRLQNGKDHASARYIFTRLRKISRTLFPAADDPVLAYLEDDGAVVEPKWFAPVIPLVLANGAAGIATGWSTSVTTYDPRALITNVRHWIESGTSGARPLLTPWFRGFTGEVLPMRKRPGHYQTFGIARLEVHADSDAAYDDEPASQSGSQSGSADGGEGKAVATVFITELPVGKATQDYKEWLESCLVDVKKARKKKKSAESDGEDTSGSESGGGGSQRGMKKKGKGAAKKKGGKKKKKSESKDGRKAGAPVVVDIRENHTERKVDFEVKISARSLAALREMSRSGSAAADDKSGAHEGMEAALIKMFALTGKGSISPDNMYLFGPEGNIKKCAQHPALCCLPPVAASSLFCFSLFCFFVLFLASLCHLCFVSRVAASFAPPCVISPTHARRARRRARTARSISAPCSFPHHSCTHTRRPSTTQVLQRGRDTRRLLRSTSRDVHEAAASPARGAAPRPASPPRAIPFHQARRARRARTAWPPHRRTRCAGTYEHATSILFCLLSDSSLHYSFVCSPPNSLRSSSVLGSRVWVRARSRRRRKRWLRSSPSKQRRARKSKSSRRSACDSPTCRRSPRRAVSRILCTVHFTRIMLTI